MPGTGQRLLVARLQIHRLAVQVLQQLVADRDARQRDVASVLDLKAVVDGVARVGDVRRGDGREVDGAALGQLEPRDPGQRFADLVVVRDRRAGRRRAGGNGFVIHLAQGDVGLRQFVHMPGTGQRLLVARLQIHRLAGQGRQQRVADRDAGERDVAGVGDREGVVDGVSGVGDVDRGDRG